MKLFWNTMFISSVFFFGCTSNNVTIDDNLQQVFNQYHAKGTFALYDNAAGTFTVHNFNTYKDSSFAPAATFNIVSALVGIETGRIINEKMLIPNQSAAITVLEAFQSQSMQPFQTINAAIGKDTMQQWLDSLAYGSKKITTAVDSFWFDRSLTIKPDEQLGLIKKLYFSQLPFQKRSQDIIKKMMLRQSNAAYKLSYITASTEHNLQNEEWNIGFVEENQHVYFFVLQAASAKNTPNNSLALPIVQQILKSYGFFEGKK